jgi:hydroxypyruvate reductase
VTEPVAVIGAIPPELRAAMAARFQLIEAVGGDRPMPGVRIALTTSMAGADAAAMDRFPDLGLLLCNGTGLDAINLDHARARGIVVRHTPDEVTEDTAEFALALIFAASRRLAEADRFVRSGRWGAERMTPSRRVAGRRVGIVGMGKIGRLIAARATALEMVVSWTGPRPKPDVSWPWFPSPLALAEMVDILILSCPGGAETAGLVDARVLAALGAEGLLINVSRGSVVDEPALIAALDSCAIAGAGLDVFAQEPGFDRRLAEFETVVLAPHYAAVTRETRSAIAATLVQAAERFLAGLLVPDAAQS